LPQTIHHNNEKLDIFSIDLLYQDVYQLNVPSLVSLPMLSTV